MSSTFASQVPSDRALIGKPADRVTFLRKKLAPTDPLKATARELIAPLRRVSEALDEVSKIHPIIGAAVLAFKV